MGPPPSKNQVTTKKKKLTRQQILIYVFSALIIISLAASFIVGSGRRSTASPSDSQVTAPIGSDENVLPPESQGTEQEGDAAPQNAETDSGN